MFCKIIILACLGSAAVDAGVLSAPQAYVQTGALHAPIATTYDHYPASAVEIHDAPAVGTSTNSITRSFDGTVSHITKAVDTPFSSVRKSVSKVSNKVYKPAYETTYLTQPLHAVSHHEPVAHIAYSPATLVSHLEFDGPYAHYAW